MFKQLIQSIALLIGYGLWEGWGRLLTYILESGILHTFVYEQILTFLAMIILKVRELTKTARHAVKHASKFLSRVSISKSRWSLLHFFLLLTVFELAQDLLIDDLDLGWKIPILIYLDQQDIPLQLLMISLMLGDIWSITMLLFWIWFFLTLSTHITKKTRSCAWYEQPMLLTALVFCLLVSIHDVPPP